MWRYIWNKKKDETHRYQLVRIRLLPMLMKMKIKKVSEELTCQVDTLKSSLVKTLLSSYYSACSCWPNSPRSALNYHENNSNLLSEHKADKENTSDVSACKTKTKSLPSQFNEQMSEYILKHQQLTHPSPSQSKDGDEMDNQVVQMDAWVNAQLTRPVRCGLLAFRNKTLHQEASTHGKMHDLLQNSTSLISCLFRIM